MTHPRRYPKATVRLGSAPRRFNSRAYYIESVSRQANGSLGAISSQAPDRASSLASTVTLYLLTAEDMQDVVSKLLAAVDGDADRGEKWISIL
jgi:hypothetical protein